jgi:hypothetical protein
MDMSKPSDLVQGTLDILLLKILALEPMNRWRRFAGARRIAVRRLDYTRAPLPAAGRLVIRHAVRHQAIRSSNNDCRGDSVSGAQRGGRLPTGAPRDAY